MKAMIMKLFLPIFTLFALLTVTNASELDRAYQKEYAFLKAQKTELAKRLETDKVQQEKDLQLSKEKVEALQSTLLEVSKNAKTSSEKLEKLSKALADKEDNGGLVGNVVNQARLTLEPYGVKMGDDNKTTDVQKIQQALSVSTKLYGELSSIRNEKGEFYLPDGKKVEGDIVKVGNVAAYGISKDAAGALAPAGNGAYKLWNAVGSSDDAKAMYAKKPNDTVNIFVYENLDKEVDYVKEKTFVETMEDGGIIGYIIFALGLFGLVLLGLRVINLMKASTNVNDITQIVVEKVESGKKHEALDAIKGFEGSTARVIKSALRNIDKDREHVEDVIMENILNESTQIDRFGGFVLVIAAVAPLMGLLGTVTGMIETFDVITEFGTGDPKLLSGGISAALVTTMQGLIVAIPLLLIGNLLSGWAQGIKDSMEQNALHIVNLYEKYRG
ncbi:MotA/TolQ/ExbB proton channel family protein [Sulfurovum sp. zt1-1]|uniref:MotA/TolQ/ExbB proton channel family protein n=1 Tax=Sulfurovum zhangzhouensis TaxID=3019067 RepID=A0ABT7QXI4_9BACT|nr:MotA/TolQ/ExbB proton channel family protein [Sulfurovum zhangzhouensis]MDM5271541.1 MotA/TolQ/ExbB proton channel family protein [Sulfurovum zhangzhouensis]